MKLIYNTLCVHCCALNDAHQPKRLHFLPTYPWRSARVVRLLKISELEGQASDLLVLSLRELIFQGREELGVHLEDEAFHVFSDGQEVLLCVLGVTLHLFVPHVDLLDTLAREDQGGSGELARVVLEKGSIQESNLLEVLREEEDLVLVAYDRGNFSVALKEAVSRGASQIKLKSHQDLHFHLKNLSLAEFVLRDSQKVLKLRRINLFVLG